LRITVKVKTESREESVEQLDDKSYLVRVKEPRRKGKANQAVIKVLRKHFGSQVTLVSGITSTVKIFEISEDQV
jgi:uncharacterized protein (TIGR00251 family)